MNEIKSNPLVIQLCALIRNWNHYEDIPNSQIYECKIIGKKLNEQGGINLMIEAYYCAKNYNPESSIIQAY